MGAGVVTGMGAGCWDGSKKVLLELETGFEGLGGGGGQKCQNGKGGQVEGRGCKRARMQGMVMLFLDFVAFSKPKQNHLTSQSCTKVP